MSLSSNSNIILFDGLCNLCNGFIQFAIKNNKTNTLKYGSLQSDIGKLLLNEFDIDSNNIDSIVFISKDKAYVKSEAVLKIAKHLRQPWSSFTIFGFLPKSLNNTIYDIVAKNRYKLFGKKTSCWVPTSDLKTKFLS